MHCLPSALPKWRAYMQINPYLPSWGYPFGKMFIFYPVSVENKLLVHFTAGKQAVIATKGNQATCQKCANDFVEPEQFTGRASAHPVSYSSKFYLRIYLQCNGKHRLESAHFVRFLAITDNPFC